MAGSRFDSVCEWERAGCAQQKAIASTLRKNQFGIKFGWLDFMYFSLVTASPTSAVRPRLGTHPYWKSHAACWHGLSFRSRSKHHRKRSYSIHWANSELVDCLRDSPHLRRGPWCLLVAGHRFLDRPTLVCFLFLDPWCQPVVVHHPDPDSVAHSPGDRPRNRRAPCRHIVSPLPGPNRVHRLDAADCAANARRAHHD